MCVPAKPPGHFRAVITEWTSVLYMKDKHPFAWAQVISLERGTSSAQNNQSSRVALRAMGTRSRIGAFISPGNSPSIMCSFNNSLWLQSPSQQRTTTIYITLWSSWNRPTCVVPREPPCSLWWWHSQDLFCNFINNRQETEGGNALPKPV